MLEYTEGGTYVLSPSWVMAEEIMLGDMPLVIHSIRVPHNIFDQCAYSSFFFSLNNACISRVKLYKENPK